MNKIHWIPLFLSLTFLGSCEVDSKKKLSAINSIYDLDSAYNILENNPTNDVGYAFSIKVKKFVQTNLDSNASNRYINKLFMLSKVKKNECFKNYAQQCKTIQQFILGNAIEARRWAQLMLESTAQNAEVDALDVYHLAGISYYTPPIEIDSTLKYWKMGFQKAVENNDNYRIYFFANNLGTVFFELDMFSVSRQFFLKALNQAKINNSVSPVLMNNILNTLIKTNDYSTAKEFYNQHRSEFDVNPMVFQNQAVYLNSILINQKMGNSLTADSLIRAFPLDSIHPSLKATYVSLHLRQFLNSGNKFFIRKYIQDQAKDCGIELLDHTPNDNNMHKNADLSFIWEIIESDVNVRLKNIENDKSHVANLITAIEILLDKYKEVNKSTYNKYLIDYANLSLSKGQSEADLNHHIAEVIRVEDLFDKLIVRNQEIELQQKNVQLLWLVLILLIIILILSFFFYRKQIEYRKQNERILLKEKDLLVRQNNMSQRAIEFSKELIQFNKKVKQDLDKLNLNADNTDFLRKFRSDLLGFISINLDQNPKAIDLSFNETEELNISDSDNIDKLNKTEKRILTLINQGFKPNEISGMLGVTTQYIYNIKTKLKRMGIELD